ncbi:MAG: hypothetical protein Q9190_006278 [Brigantiaea leucoxantha]
MTQRYIHGHHPSVLSIHGWRTVKNSAAFLLSSLKPDMHILDVGCGPGTLTTDLATYVPQGRVVGVEPTADPLEQARTFAAERKVENVSFQTGDIRALPFPDQTFDIVYAHQVVQYLDDRAQAIREMRRVTKTGGFVAIRDADQATHTWYPDVDGMKEFQELYARTARANGGEPNAGRQVHAWAKQSGFEWSDITASASNWCFNTAEERAWWSNAWIGRCTESDFAKTSIEKGYVSESEMGHIVQGWRDWGASEYGWYAIMHGEVLCRVP